VCRVKAHDGGGGAGHSQNVNADSSLPTCKNRAGAAHFGNVPRHPWALTSVGWFFDFSNNHGFRGFCFYKKNESLPSLSSRHAEEGYSQIYRGLKKYTRTFSEYYSQSAS